MKKSIANQQEKKCSNCHPKDEKTALIQKELLKHKLENDTLISKLKQLSEESKKIIDTIVVPKLAKPTNQEQQEGVVKKELENAKKQMEFYEKRIKQMEKAQENQSFDAYTKTVEDLKQLESDIDKAKAKNQQLKNKQREQEKILLSDQPVNSRNDIRKEIELLMSKLNYEQKVLEKKKENRDKLMKKIDETEAKYKELCTKNNVTPIQRPDLTVSLEELEIPKTRLRNISKSKSDVNVLKYPKKNVRENALPQESQKPIRISESMILQSKQNVGRISMSIKSFEKTHILRLTELQLQEKQISASKAEAEKDLETVQQECLKAHQLLKELQRIPRDSVIQSSKIQPLITEVSPIEDASLPLANSSKALSTKNRFRKEVQGIKVLTEQTLQWRDFEILPDDKLQKINSLKIYFKDHYLVRIETGYKLLNGDLVQSIQPPNSDDILNERDIKTIDIKFSRTEYIQEISGFYDSTHITLLKVRTSQFKEYLAGDQKMNYKQKQFKFNILPAEKPISFFGNFDSIKNQNKKVLVQLGAEIMKKDIFTDNSSSISTLKTANFSEQVQQNNKKNKDDQEIVF
ncbi:hypothetical protein ABPG72_007937 [Tetrahymena utriculariae]